MSYKVKHNLEDRFVLERADGTHFSVAKKGLGEGTMTKLQSFADGGLVEEVLPERIPASVAEQLAPAAPVAQPGLGSIFSELGKQLGVGGVTTASRPRNTIGGEPVFTDQVAVPTEAQANVQRAPLEASSAPVALTLEDLPADPQAAPASGAPAADPLKGIMDQKQSAIDTTMRAEQKLAADNIQTQNFLLNEQKASQERMAKLTAEYDRVSQEQLTAMKTDKIKPQTYWSNKNTAEKIGTGIALVLGGLAGGLDKSGKNQAAEFLDNQIKQDIDIQKNNLDRKDNLFAANLKRYGTLIDAETATKRDLMVSAQAMLEINRNKATSQLAKAKADEASAGLKANIMVLNQQLAASKSMDPMMAKILKLPEKFQAQAIKEQGILEKKRTGQEGVKQSFAALSKIGAIAANLPFSESKAKLEALNAGLIAKAMQSVKGNPSESEFRNQVKPYLVSGTDTVAQIKQKELGMLKYIEDNAEPTPTLQLFKILPKAPFVPNTQPRQPRKH